MEHSERSDLARRVMNISRAELTSVYPPLEGAFACLRFVPSAAQVFRTDGVSLFYPEEKTLALYRDDPAALRRGLMHVLMHCLYGHVLLPERTDRALWGRACDTIAEAVLDGEHSAMLTPADRHAHAAAARVARMTPDMLLKTDGLPELRDDAAFDDHSLWGTQPQELVKSRWKGFRGFGGGGLGKGGQRGSMAGDEEEAWKPPESKRAGYRRYLRRFAVPGEVCEPDYESFDYIAYRTGLEHFGNMPLIEPLEYREVSRLDEIVIAIDTSGSCSREMVSAFLEEAREILTCRENFFREMKAVFIQCDENIQDLQLIRSTEQWQSYAKGLKIRGRGGTDFCPVFREISRLRAEKLLKKPRVLLYYTDGDGVYPSVPPDYETAFLLAGENCRPELVPRWARLFRL